MSLCNLMLQNDTYFSKTGYFTQQMPKKKTFYLKIFQSRNSPGTCLEQPKAMQG